MQNNADPDPGLSGVEVTGAHGGFPCAAPAAVVHPRIAGPKDISPWIVGPADRLPVLYVASFGPAAGIKLTAAMGENAAGVYRPISWSVAWVARSYRVCGLEPKEVVVT